MLGLGNHPDLIAGLSSNEAKVIRIGKGLLCFIAHGKHEVVQVTPDWLIAGIIAGHKLRIRAIKQGTNVYVTGVDDLFFALGGNVFIGTDHLGEVARPSRAGRKCQTCSKDAGGGAGGGTSSEFKHFYLHGWGWGSDNAAGNQR